MFIQDTPTLIVFEQVRRLRKVTWMPSRIRHSSVGRLLPGTHHLVVSGPITRPMADTHPGSGPLVVPRPDTCPGAISPSRIRHPAVPGTETCMLAIFHLETRHLAVVRTCHPSRSCLPVWSYCPALPGPIARPGSRLLAVPSMSPIRKLSAGP